jgi:hypothetical protein
MRRTLWVVLIVLLAAGRSASAQQDEIAQLKAEIARQQAVLDELVRRMGDLEVKQGQAVTTADLEAEASTQEDTVNSLRENVLGRVNLNGYLNTRFFADQSDEVNAFQVNPLGIVMSKQLGRFNLFSEVYLAHIPHHARIVPPPSEEALESSASEAAGDAHSETAADVSGEGQVEVRNAWMEYNHSRAFNMRVGKFLSPQYFWQNHYPNVVLSTDLPIHLRELFPPELVGVMASGMVAKPMGSSELGFGYKAYLSNNESEQLLRGDVSNDKSWGGRLELHLPINGRLKLLNVAADLYQGRSALTGTTDLVHNSVWGVEEQLELDRFMLNTEYARGHWLGRSRFGYYLQPAFRVSDEWIGFYRLEGLESARVQEAERRHLLGINYRPRSQVALKLEYYRSVPLSRSFIFVEQERKPFSGIASAAAFFF